MPSTTPNGKRTSSGGNNGNNAPGSRPRPIHSLSRMLRDAPDESEPSSSYEESSFLSRVEDSMEDEFHRKMGAATNRNLSGNGSGGLGASQPSPGGSFWRTDNNVGSSEVQWKPGMAGNKPPTTVKERKQSGGLLGAALQLHSQSSNEGTNNNHGASGGASQNKKSSNGKNSPSVTKKNIFERGGDNKRSGSNISLGSGGNGSGREKKDATKHRAEARRLKSAFLNDGVDIGHVADDAKGKHADTIEIQYSNNTLNINNMAVDEKSAATSSTRSGEETSSGTDWSAIYSSSKKQGSQQGGRGGVLAGASSNSLIFPTGVDDQKEDSMSDATKLKRQKINLRLDQCEASRFAFRKKLILSSMDLTAADIPVKDLSGSSLGKTLHKLSLAGNRLSAIPAKLVNCLPALQTLNLSQCELRELPNRWNLPQLKRLNVSHNRLMDFPEESMLQGLLELQELNMYGNKITEVVVPHNPKYLAKLAVLNLGYNDLAFLPEDLDRLKALRTLNVTHNFLDKIPMRICDMDLKSIDVSSNPVIQPPIETCERGICSMKRYYHCLRMEEQSKRQALEALQSKAAGRTNSSKMKTRSKKFSMSKLWKASDESTSQTSTARDEADKFPPKIVNESRIAASKSISKSKVEDNTSSLKLPSSTQKDLSEDKKSPFSMSSSELTPSVELSTKFESEEMSVTKTSVDGGMRRTSDETTTSSVLVDQDEMNDVTINDTLKVIFVGMAMAGKTSMIRRLIEGENAPIPKRDDRTVGVDIYEWDPKDDHRFEHIDSRINIQDAELKEAIGEANVKFSVWDFAGQHVYHATHELFFSPRALYVLVWDMGANNAATMPKKTDQESNKGAFSLSYDSEDDSSKEDEFTSEEETRRADRALERDIDDKVQFWVDCIQSSAPGAAILPVASFDDFFSANDNGEEARRRCVILKKRLLTHETRRLQGVKDRLRQYEDENRANEEGAMRLRKLLGTYTRPKIIFGPTDNDAVVRVSGKTYTGFAHLTERIMNIATGRDQFQYSYPIFRGHVGARIPRMRLDVRKAVRELRDRFKVVEWGYFIAQLQKLGLTSVEDISDALHFLTNIGELSYFGGVLPDRERGPIGASPCNHPNEIGDGDLGDNDAVSVEDDDDEAFLSIDNTETTFPETEEGSISTLGSTMTGGLSQFVFLNPRWLVAAVACILRHDLENEIQETRRSLMIGQTRRLSHGESFYEVNMNCPVITAEDACMLWQAKKFTKKAAERAQEHSNQMKVKPFEFLQLLLIKFAVFVPIDLGIEKAFLGGIEYSHKKQSGIGQTPDEISVPNDPVGAQATFFFLPSLLGPGEPAEAWTYKNSDSWKATLCHSVLFPDGVPPGLMERIMATVLSNIYDITNKREQPAIRSIDGSFVPMFEGKLTVKEVLSWRSAFLVKLGMQTEGENKESIVEIFCGLVDKDSHLCVGGNSMGASMRRLVTSGKGQEGDGARKIWKGGYLIVLKAVQRVMEQYGGLEYEKHGFCSECLAKKAVGDASYWDFTMIRRAVANGESTLWCAQGHRVDTRLVAGPADTPTHRDSNWNLSQGQGDSVPVNDLLRGVVIVGLWDGKSRKVVRVGSGFIADKRRGLIVTASHTLMNIWGDKSSPFGDNYYGLRQGKVVIGVISRNNGEGVNTEAVFRYFAKIVAKDPSIDQGACQLDACVLKITTRMENDVSGSGETCGDQPEQLLVNNPQAMKNEKLQSLKITEKCELDEQVRIVGFNQGGEGLLGPGMELNRYVDFARGYVCKMFVGLSDDDAVDNPLRNRFKPKSEIVVLCATIGGHSGGPCVNQQGEVIGILSRADPAETQRCYLVPTREWRPLLKEAKKAI